MLLVVAATSRCTLRAVFSNSDFGPNTHGRNCAIVASPSAHRKRSHCLRALSTTSTHLSEQPQHTPTLAFVFGFFPPQHALARFTEDEVLTGDNKYRAKNKEKDFGLQVCVHDRLELGFELLDFGLHH